MNAAMWDAVERVFREYAGDDCDVLRDAVRDLQRAFLWKRAADTLADEVAALVQLGVLDSRSAAADALLDYRNPPTSPRSDRLAALELELEQLKRRTT